MKFSMEGRNILIQSLSVGQILNVKVIAKVSDRENDNFLDNINVNISISL